MIIINKNNYKKLKYYIKIIITQIRLNKFILKNNDSYINFIIITIVM